MKPTLFVERALFVVGEPNDGKSTQLRSIFVDRRFGTGGKIPAEPKLRNTYPLSHDRGLYLRLTSPHEYGETPREFIDKIRQATLSGRWVVACPLQPHARNKMPGVVDCVKLFQKAFSPERVRVCFLSPSKSGDASDADLQGIASQLWGLDRVECVVVDARTRSRNGLIYSDFFDYT